jgi:RNA polymerase sigma-70 factor (ECF subfamily)
LKDTAEQVNRPKEKPTLSDGLSDDELMSAAQSDNPAAFNCLVRRHQRAALQVAARILGSTAEAEDAVQNAFFNIYRRRFKYQTQGCFRAFLYRVVVNEARMKLRSWRRWKTALALLINTTQPSSPPTGLQESVWRALERLPLKQRMVLALRFGADLPLEEIGAILGLPVGTVKSRLFCGLRRLRCIVEGESR